MLRQPQPAAQARTQRGNLGTGKVHRAIGGHEHLHSFHLAVVSANWAALVHVFVGEVLDGVAENLQARPA